MFPRLPPAPHDSYSRIALPIFCCLSKVLRREVSCCVDKKLQMNLKSRFQNSESSYGAEPPMNTSLTNEIGHEFLSWINAQLRLEVERRAEEESLNRLNRL